MVQAMTRGRDDRRAARRTWWRARMPFTRQVMAAQIAVVLGLGLVALVAFVLVERSYLSTQFQQRALAVARTVAQDQGLGDLVAARDGAAVRAIAGEQERATGALFVVVTDDRGIRLAHPNPDEVGRPVSTSPDEALSGREVADVSRGTLGLSARGKVPLRDSAGAVVGEVSVGFSADEIGDAWRRVLWAAVPVGFVGVAVAGTLAWLLARRLKRATFGMEPADVAELVREREAVLYGIGDGVLAVDVKGWVTTSNAEAERLLGRRIEPGRHVDDLGLPERLRAALADEDGGRVIAVAGDRVVVAQHRRVVLDGIDLGSVLTMQDRTDLEQLTSELAAVRTMTTALRAQRHEFANRIHTVLGLLEADAVDDAVDYLQGCTRFATAEVVSPRTVASNTVRALVAAKAARAGELGVGLAVSEGSWVPAKLAAPVEVVTVLGNLVDNAIDAAAGSTVRPARVEIDLLADGSELVVSVANTGDGIPADRIDAIFAGGVTSHGEGRGLGLAVARGTARDLGGDLRVTAAGGDGNLTVFVGTLPGVLVGRPASVVPELEGAR
ncbi:ATP-binding protein [Luteimicrobium sp. DT211]|uniref:ATP-binding protein n=1 Tax=Luteimicrobium sp. DT211 TaxID=3393412 RepID=UPI003CF5FDBB